MSTAKLTLACPVCGEQYVTFVSSLRHGFGKTCSIKCGYIRRTRMAVQKYDALKEKQCGRCGEIKPVGEFFKQSLNRPGYRSYCKECNRTSGQEWKVANLGRHHRIELMTQMRRRLKKPLETKAVELLNRAVRLGKLKRLPCVVCGTTERVQGHHEDYSKPLDVIWLCSRHHREHHLLAKRRMRK